LLPEAGADHERTRQYYSSTLLSKENASMSAVISSIMGMSRQPASTKARLYGIIFLAAGLLIFIVFATATTFEQTTTFVLTPGGQKDATPVPDIEFPSALALYACAAICVFLGVFQLSRATKEMGLAMGAVALVFVFAFLTWAARDNSLNLTGMLSSSLLRSVPIALAGLSGLLCERSAVINIAIEGMMLFGALFAAVGGSIARNIWMWEGIPAQLFGLLWALIIGGLLGLLLAVLAVRFKVNQIIAGTAINTLAVGVTSFMSGRILAEFQDLNNVGTFPRMTIPVLSTIPVIGPIFFDQNGLVYVLFVLVIAIHIMLFYTPWGLRSRAVGEHPKAADTLGINVFQMRYINVIMGGMVAGLAGAFLILGSVGRFDELMTAGKGFIGLAAMIFGKWMPFGVFGAALIFGFADALQTKLAILEVPIPSQILLMAPYIVTMVALAGVVGEAIPPAADGQPYEKQ
jgi:simple sugar transport system permease protein